jgi:hypothetical protein
MKTVTHKQPEIKCHYVDRIGSKLPPFRVDHLSHAAHGHNLVIRFHSALPGIADMVISTDDPARLYRELSAAAAALGRSLGELPTEVM